MNEFFESLKEYLTGNNNKNGMIHNGNNGLAQPLLPVHNAPQQQQPPPPPQQMIYLHEQDEFVDKFCERIRIFSGREAQFITDLLLGISYGYNKKGARFWWIQNGHFVAKFCAKHYELEYVFQCVTQYGSFQIYSNADIRKCMEKLIVLFGKRGRTLATVDRVPWDVKHDDKEEEEDEDEEQDRDFVVKLSSSSSSDDTDEDSNALQSIVISGSKNGQETSNGIIKQTKSE